MATEIITQVWILPDGLPIEHYEANSFMVEVVWRGVQNDKKSMGGYAVKHGNKDLTRAGNWIYNPQPFQYHLCRWSTLEEALEVARKFVNKVEVRGKTWAEWKDVLGGTDD